MPENVLREGKTKVLTLSSFPDHVQIKEKDKISKGDGSTVITLEGKGDATNIISSNVFELLRYCGLPVAHDHKDASDSRIARYCKDLPFEVVTRVRAYGSYLKRHPEFVPFQEFIHPVVEFYLKTTGKNWNGHELPCDDPLMRIGVRDGVHVVKLYRPSSVGRQGLFLTFSFSELVAQCSTTSYPLSLESFMTMGTLAARTCVLLERVWSMLDCQMLDLKVEFGVHHGRLLLMEAGDNDAWRLRDSDGNFLCKQYWREGGDPAVLLENYKKVAALTNKFVDHYGKAHTFATHGRGSFPRIVRDWMVPYPS